VNYGAELEAAWGPFSLPGEYVGIDYHRDPGIIVFQGAPGASFVRFSGFYAYATWYLTSESRAEQYRSYEEFNAPGNGNVAQIKILNPWSAGGWGAWELAARVSEINLNSGGNINPVLGTTFTASPVSSATNILNIQGGRQSDFTLGLNWYPDKGIRFMANWVNVFQYSAPFNRPDLNGIHPNSFILRAQVDW
jgi:phosphate-selective porin OprO/OprP